MNRLTKKLTAVGIAGGVAVSGGVAWALWPSTATGDSTATARNAVAVTVAAATGAADLYPGFTGGALHFTVTNSNPYPVTFTSMTAGTITSSNESSCPAANVTVAPATISLPVAANASDVAKSITNVVTMVSAAPAGCQGAVFTIPLTLTGSQT